MKQLNKRKFPHRRSWCGIGLCLVVTLALQAAARGSQVFSDWYAAYVYSFFVGTLGRLWSIFPFSVVELALYLGALFLLFSVVCLCVLVGQKKLHPGAALLTLLRGGLWIISSLLLSFTLLAGINYQRQSFADAEGLVVVQSSREELVALCELLLTEVNAAAEEIHLDENGRCAEVDQMTVEAVKAMRGLEDAYDSLAGYYPRPKPVWISEILSVQQVTGVYSPFTVEANYNQDIPAYSLPYTVCHELSHLKGFMREEEANYIGWLACRESELPEFRYSGALVGFVYATNALYRYDRELYHDLLGRLCQTAIIDLTYNSQFWDQYEGVAAEVHEKVNDVYLKANSQADGVESYGRVVELMLAYFRQTAENEEVFLQYIVNVCNQIQSRMVVM